MPYESEPQCSTMPPNVVDRVDLRAGNASGYEQGPGCAGELAGASPPPRRRSSPRRYAFLWEDSDDDDIHIVPPYKEPYTDANAPQANTVLSRLRVHLEQLQERCETLRTHVRVATADGGYLLRKREPRPRSRFMQLGSHLQPPKLTLREQADEVIGRLAGWIRCLWWTERQIRETEDQILALQDASLSPGSEIEGARFPASRTGPGGARSQGLARSGFRGLLRSLMALSVKHGGDKASNKRVMVDLAPMLGSPGIDYSGNDECIEDGWMELSSADTDDDA